MLSLFLFQSEHELLAHTGPAGASKLELSLLTPAGGAAACSLKILLPLRELSLLADR